ncbi:MAG: hypothetical protein SFU21_00165, partial [Flavihumibacter sp.]|nr:hypothetical protein [Flavihumibacter sp.]
NDIGLTIRYNKINSGSIKYEHRQSEAMNIFRKKNLTDLLIPRDIYLSTLSKYFENNKTDSTEILNKELKEAENEVYKEFLKKELEYLENGNYNSSISHWFSFGLTLPYPIEQPHIVD